MILGKNYIFIAVPKTGSVSVRTALKRHPFLLDHDPFAGTMINTANLSNFRNSHIPLSMAMEDLNLTNKFKFGFVRNPFDRFVSFCAWSMIRFNVRDDTGTVVEKVTFENEPTRYMDLMLRRENQIKKMTTMIWPMQRFLCVDGKIGVDYIGCYERLQESYDHICDTIGFERESLPHKNKSIKKYDFRSYYTTDLVDRVGEFYKTDLETFGYTFE